MRKRGKQKYLSSSVQLLVISLTLSMGITYGFSVFVDTYSSNLTWWSSSYTNTADGFIPKVFADSSLGWLRSKTRRE